MIKWHEITMMPIGTPGANSFKKGGNLAMKGI
jgi:hypothetical protein